MKTFSAFDVMEQNGGDFNREEECKISMLVSSASNQVHVKVFFLSLKDPESLTLFKPFASHVLIFGTTLFLGELKCFDIVLGDHTDVTLKVILSLFDLQNFLLLSKGIC